MTRSGVNGVSLGQVCVTGVSVDRFCATGDSGAKVKPESGVGYNRPHHQRHGIFTV